MGVDIRTRRHADARDLGVAEVFDGLLPEATEQNGALAARGLAVKALPPMSLRAEGRSLTLAARGGRLEIVAGETAEATVAELDAAALSNLVQDRQTTMGLAMNSQVKIQQGDFAHWIAWEPVFRALFDGRRVHEAGDIVLKDEDGAPLDVHRSFELGDAREEKAHFLSEAGFLHVRDVFDAAEMAAISADLDDALAAARADDGESWWAGDASGQQQAVRVLWFHEKSEALARLIRDERLQWIADLTGDGHDGAHIGAEGLIKPLGITTGLSDLPWHKDCGQGMHSYMCCGLTVGISVTGADRVSGALGVVPGSHRANCQTAGRDVGLDLQPLKLETRTGDITIHCGDTLHRAHPPTERPRKVVYTHFPLRPQPGDVVPKPPTREARAARAKLTDVRDRIRASGGGAKA
jgi:ectoine hydroxylase-related dioxygenase (phytanoyl-CoA dioxygenase family)